MIYPYVAKRPQSKEEQEIARLRTIIENLGACPKCGQVMDHDVLEPFAHCKCGTAEWTQINEYPLIAMQVRDHNNAVLFENLLKWFEEYHREGEKCMEDFRDCQFALDVLQKRMVESGDFIANIKEQLKVTNKKLEFIPKES